MADSNATLPTIGGTAPTGEVGVAYNYSPTITSTGSFTVAVTDGKLPAGLILNATSGAITGKPTTEGDFNFTLSVTDANGSASAKFTGTVYPVLSITGVPPKGKTGVVYSFQPVVAGGSGNYTYTVTGDSGGLTLNKTTGVISGTPPTSGNYAMVITVNDGLTSKDLSINIEIDQNIVVQFTNSPGNGYLGEAYSWTPTFINATAGATLTVVVLKGTLPDGLSLDAHTGIISGTPTSIETASFELNVSDGNTASTKSFTMNVYQPLKLTGEPSIGKVGSPYAFAPEASGGDSSQYVFTLVSGPGSDVFPLKLNAQTGDVSGTPVVGGVYKLTLSVTDGTAVAETTFTLNIRKLLAISGVPDSAIIGTPFKFAPTVEGGTGNYTFSSTMLVPSPLTFDPATGIIKGFPSTPGKVSGTITVDDGESTASLDVTLTFSDRHAYMVGFRLEHFTGYGGVGSPNYASVQATNSSETYQQGCIAISDACPQNTSGWGYGCLWRNFTDENNNPAKLNNFWACMEVWLPPHGTTTEASLAQLAPVVFHGNDESAFIFLRADPVTANAYRVLLAKDLTDTTTFIDTGISLTHVNEVSSYYFHVTGAGTANGQITVYYMGTPRAQWITIGTWSGNMTDYKDFSAFSFHKAFAAQTNYLFYAFVTNYDLHFAYLRYTVATGEGTETGWSGDTTTFGTYPVTYNLTGGLYATEAGQTMTLKFGADIAPIVGVEPKTVILSGAFVTDSSATTAPIKGVVKDSTGTITEIGPSQTPDDQGEAFMWVMSKNPVTGALWDAAAASGFEYGYRRIEPPLAPLTLTGSPDKAYVGREFTFLPTAAGGNNTLYTFTSTALPAGLTLDAKTGNITGTPTTDGSTAVTITLTDTLSTVSLNTTFVVNPVISITGTTPNQLYLSKAATWTPTIKNIAAGQTAAVTVTSGAVPKGMSLNASTGVISGTATVSGDYPVTLSVTDGLTTGTIDVVFNVAEAIALTGDAPKAGRVGTAYSWTPTIVNAIPNSTPTVTTAQALPDGLALNPTTGAITGTPTTAGASVITLSVTDGNTTATRDVNLTFTAAVGIGGTPAVGYTTDSYAWTPTFTNQDLTGTLSVKLATGSSLPDGLTVDEATGLISGIPTVAADTTFTLDVSDGYSTGSGVFTITVKKSVTLGGDAPTAAKIGEAFTWTPTITDAVDATKVVVSTTDTLPAGLTLTAATGVISGTPTVAASTDITLKVTDGTSTSTRKITLVFTDPATFGGTPPVGYVGKAYTFTPEVSGTADGSTIAYAVDSTTPLPAGLTLSATTGVVSGTPTAAAATPVTIDMTETLSGGTVLKRKLAVTITIDTPIGIAYGDGTAAATVGTAATITPTITNAIEGATLTATVTQVTDPSNTVSTDLPSGLAIAAETGVISGTPAAATDGKWTIAISITDGTNTATTTVTLTIAKAAE